MKKRITKKTRLNLYMKFYHTLIGKAAKEDYRGSNMMTFNNLVLQYYTPEQIITMLNSDEPLVKDLSDMTNYDATNFELYIEYHQRNPQLKVSYGKSDYISKINQQYTTWFKLILEVALESRTDYQRQVKLNELLN